MAIDTKMRTYGQNLDVCLRILQKSYLEFANETGIAVTRLERLKTGEVTMSVAELETIARELSVLPLTLTRTYREERREEELRSILSASNLEMDILLFEEARLPPTIKKQGIPPVIVVAATPPQPLLATPAVLPVVKVTSPQERHQGAQPELQQIYEKMSQHKPLSTTPVGTKRALKTESISRPTVITTVDPLYVVSIDGVPYNLRDRELRKAVADRIRFARGSLPARELGLRLRRKRTFSWLNTLSGVTPEELSDIAEKCSTTLQALVTGEGITGLRSGEKATSWIKRYAEDNSAEPSLEEVALKLKEHIDSFPPAIQFMLAKYLAEII